MSARAGALTCAVLAIGLTFVQDALPARDWYHSWQYVTVMAVVVAVPAVYAFNVARGRASGKRFALALCGAIAVGVAGLLSGLIGPDTVTVIGTPGTVTPVPDLNAAAFFPSTDPEGLIRGDARVTLRSRVAAERTVGAQPVPIGLSVAFTQPRPAAFVVARDAGGNRLTVTQPNNPSFLSPVMLFRQTQDIHGRSFPLDTFALPGVHRVVRILYFSASDLAAFRHDAVGDNAPGAILSVTDDAGGQQGLIMAASGREVTLGGVRILVTLGTYPVLAVASAPQPLVMLGGAALFALALIWSRLGPRSEPAAAFA